MRTETPITVREKAPVPLRPTMRWVSAPEGSLYKKFVFKSTEERNRFIVDILEYERVCGHSATMKIAEGCVMMSLITHDIGVVTELDKEFAREADVVYKDVTETYISSHDNWP